MKKVVTLIIASVLTLVAYAQPQANFSTDKFENFTLHTYASFDPLADVSFIIESKDSLLILEPQAFKGNVEEFLTYTKKLNKPVAKVLVSFHAAGLKVYPDAEKVITQAMADFMKSDAAKGMLGFFNQAFKGAMDTEVVTFDEPIDANSTFMVDGVAYVLKPTAVPGMPGVNISIGDEVYYQHFAPAVNQHVSKNQIKGKDGIDGALTDALSAKKGKYSLLLGAHGEGKASVSDLDFQIEYLKTMQKLAVKATTADNFVVQMNAKYPDCKGEEDLVAIAASLYQ